jgi:hypothetical protein
MYFEKVCVILSKDLLQEQQKKKTLFVWIWFWLGFGNCSGEFLGGFFEAWLLRLEGNGNCFGFFFFLFLFLGGISRNK